MSQFLTTQDGSPAGTGNRHLLSGYCPPTVLEGALQHVHLQQHLVNLPQICLIRFLLVNQPFGALPDAVYLLPPEALLTPPWVSCTKFGLMQNLLASRYRGKPWAPLPTLLSPVTPEDYKFTLTTKPSCQAEQEGGWNSTFLPSRMFHLLYLVGWLVGVEMGDLLKLFPLFNIKFIFCFFSLTLWYCL